MLNLFQTEFDVCFYCGSLYECVHDAEPSSSDNTQPRRESIHRHEEKEFDSYYEMVSNSAILPHEEVFNTYGETLTNAQLLVQYGFILDVNDSDRLTWDVKDVCTDHTGISVGACTSDLPRLEYIWSAVLSCATVSRMLERIAESNLVYVHDETSVDVLCLDGEGKISHPLWILLALPFCLQHIQGNLTEQLGRIAGDLEALLYFQIAVERVLENSDGDSQPIPSSATHAPMLAGMAHSLINLCLARKSQLGQPLSHGSDMNDVLDDLQGDMVRTREALTIAIGERSVLESCVSAWEDLALLYPVAQFPQMLR
ncbi:hypothetical protein DXG03_004036 [Asterophora parasitica]|uniref:Uncharacterized protein n=1 Tax=Asterophora parasitica TaxID=117018 RepID=A0A9P7GF71_9AGAR|nr:hypothetical protein DXG03_004036 [Asterophora parasitica]